MVMQRGEIWWAELELPDGRRPVLLLSRDESYRSRELILAARITTRIRNIRSEVILTENDGVPKLCVVNLDVIQTISKNLLIERITSLSPEKLQAVETAIHFSMGLSF
jgi:mRNA interferase MazF